MRWSILTRTGAALLAIGFAHMPAAPSAAPLAGPYLAAMQADFRNDYVAAAQYYARALAADRTNPVLMQSAIVANVALGRIDVALPIADRLETELPGNQIGGIVRLADAFAREDYAAAAAITEAAPDAELNPLLRALSAGWALVGREDFKAALERFDAMDANDAMRAYGQYHKALALALAGDFEQSEAILAAGGEDERLYPDRMALLAHAEILAQIDRREDAIAVLRRAASMGYPDMSVNDLLARLEGEGDVAFTQIVRASDGAAAAYMTLANALNGENSDRLALVYSRLADHVREGYTEAELLAAEVLERHEQYELATAALGVIPKDSPWFVTAELRRAATQRAAGDPDAGIATLQALAAAYPDLLEVQAALGDALRTENRHVEAAEAYSAAIALIPEPERIHWVLFYTRAIAYERSGQWDRAEADFRKALDLEPDQPMVLNYLGYSLVEQRRNLDEALAMIEKAVLGQPDDGYITDSLGWVLYRLGRYEEAVPHMLRAVELTPEDAIINDHLGDVLWMVGRKREAQFQWRRALSLGPAEDLDMDRIRRKLEVGLDEVLAEEKATGQGG